MKSVVKKASIKDVMSRVEQNVELFSIITQLSNLSLDDRGASSSSVKLKSPSLVSILTPTASILERFKMRTNPSAFTKNVIEMTKAPFIDIHKHLLDLSDKSSSYMMSLGFRFMPGQGEFLVKELRTPESFDELRKLRDSLGLSLTKGGLSSSPLVKLKGLSDSVMTRVPALASRILVEAITFNEGYYGRFIILVQMGIGCTVWYGFTPGDGMTLPMEGLSYLFSPIENYDSFFNNPDVHVQPGFNKITLVEGVDNPAGPLSQAFAKKKPFMDIDIEMPGSNKSILVGVSLGLAVAILFTFGVSPCSGELIL